MFWITPPIIHSTYTEETYSEYMAKHYHYNWCQQSDWPRFCQRVVHTINILEIELFVSRVIIDWPIRDPPENYKYATAFWRSMLLCVCLHSTCLNLMPHSFLACRLFLLLLRSPSRRFPRLLMTWLMPSVFFVRLSFFDTLSMRMSGIRKFANQRRAKEDRGLHSVQP